ncbi:MAG: serine/threonine protein kinase [Deltaproteobacteria bacterium]|nr:serine/threonine protein kinase [Deltaproteobacteria bacterium]
METEETARRFHVLREIASGTFGSVYLAKETHADGFSRIVAVKILHRRWSESEDIARRLRDEARLLGRLRHRNIVEVLDLTTIDGRTAIVMEYLEAADLHVVVGDLKERQETVPLRAALEIGASVASALDAAFNRPPFPGERPLRVIHRDIKPSNVMVDDGGQVKVLDFGVARADFEARESNTRELQFGSINYMPPERLFFEPDTPASDLYSLGASLFEILALEKLGKAKGRPDRHAGFVLDRLSFLVASRGLEGRLGSDLEHLLSSMLAYDDTDRPSAAQVATTCRDLGREAGGIDLHDWASAAIPPIVTRQRESERPPNPLNDRIVAEDGQVLEKRPGTPVTDEPAASDTRPPGDGVRHLGTVALAALRSQISTPPAESSPPKPAPPPVRTTRRAAPPQPEPELLQPSRFAPLPLSAMESIPPIAPLIPPEPAPRPPPVDLRVPTHTTHPPTEAPEPRVPRLFPGGDLQHPDAMRVKREAPRPVRSRTVSSGSSRGIPIFQASTLEDFYGRASLSGRTRSRTGQEPAPLDLRLSSPPPPPALGSPAVVPLPAARPSPPVPVPARRAPPLRRRLGSMAATLVLMAGPVAGSFTGAVAFDLLLPRALLARTAQPTSSMPPAITGPASEFRTSLPDIRTFQVHCTKTAASGADRVSLVVQDDDTCTVTAIRADRSRLVAVVKAAGPGSWTCFEGSEHRCVPDAGAGTP